MKKFKILPFVVIASAFLLGIRSPQKAVSLNTENIVRKVEAPNLARSEITPERALVIPDGAQPISTKAEWLAFFNNTGESTLKSAYLTNDIDLEGQTYGIGVHGDYVGIFEGNGFTVSNFTINQNLFHFVGSNGEIRNLNLRLFVGGSSMGFVYQQNGLIDNVKLELTINKNVNHIGGFAQQGGSGTISNSGVDFLFKGAGASSDTMLRTVTWGGGTPTIVDSTYYQHGLADPSKLVNQGLTLRDNPLFGEIEVLPEVEVQQYNPVIYVEEEPKSVEVTAELVNTEEEAVWSIDSPTGVGTIADVDLDDEVATVTALAKGTVSFKFKATIDGEDYLSELVTIQVLTSRDDYVIPDNPIEIGTKAQFLAYFDIGAAHLDRNLLLTADIDLEGHEFGGGRSQGKAGTYIGIFEGQGYTIRNLKANSLFNEMSAAAEVRNLNVELTNKWEGSGAIATINNGTIKNVKVKVTVIDGNHVGGVHAYGGMSLIGSGKFIDCHTDFIIKTNEKPAVDLYPVVQADAGKDVTNCSWTIINGTTAQISTGSGEVTHDFIREGALGFALWMMDHEGGDIYTGKVECEAKWEAAILKWGALSEDSKTQVRELEEFEDAWLRLQAWAAANGTTPDAAITGNIGTTPTNSLGAALIIGLIGVSTTALYCALLKTKRQEETK